jgi:PTH1 family peptidyl-tRNA hydrolase
VKLIVGLGNPGRKYCNTRHNVGWWALDDLAGVLGLGESDESECCEGLMAEARDVVLFKPLTWMNDSGRAVAAILAFRGLHIEDMLVVLDDLNLPLGTLRIRPAGSAGGHRGLQSVVDSLGTDKFARLRVGIGPAPQSGDWRDFVLSPFEETELPLAEKSVARAVQAMQCWLSDGVEAAMNRFNGPVEPPPPRPQAEEP